MNKKILRKILIVFGILAGIVLLANIGLNIWLKNNLPNYIKNNSHYKVSYNSLNVEVVSGNIQATGISVATKNPDDQNVIGLDGSIDSLNVSRLGIWDALVNKVINSSNLLMVNPKLKITLAKPIDDRTGRKRNPVGFRNITVRKGNILMLRHTKQKFVSVNDLDLDVSHLKMTEEAVEDKLPVVFDEYSIKGKNFYYRPDNVYVLKANTITTENGQMSIKDFKLIPLLSYAQFTRFYPKKKNLFDFKTKEMDFKDIVLKNNRISLSQMTFTEPDLKIYTTNAKPTENTKDFKYEVNLVDVAMNNAKIHILKPNGSKLFSAGNLNMGVSKMLMDETTAKGNIPFSYEKFLISGKDINYITETQNVVANSFVVNPTSAEVLNLSVKPTVSKSDKSLADLSAAKIALKLNEWKFVNNKLKLDAQSALVTGLNGRMMVAEKKQKRPDYSKISFPLKVRNVQIVSPQFSFGRGEELRSFNNLVVKVNNLEMNEETVKKKIPFKTGNFSATTRNFSHQINRFYMLNAGLIKTNNNSLQINNLVLKTIVTRNQFIKMIPTERDLFDVKVSSLTANGNWDLLSENQYLYANQVTVSGMYANVFRSKVPRDNMEIKPMPSAHLRKIKFPLIVNNLDIKNSVFEYEEDSKESWAPGKLTFGDFNANVKNLNSGKTNGKPTQIPITIRSRFMNASPMNVKWNIDTSSRNDAFTISGNIADLPAARINAFIEPYLKARASGTIQDLIFNFKGTVSSIGGTMNMKHKNLKVELLKETGEKKKLLSAVVNIFVKSNSGHFPESVTVEGVQREPEKSFFNMFWRGLQEGLKKILIGNNIDKTEKTVKNTASDVKGAAKDGTKAVKNVAEKVKTAVDETVNPEEPKKDGFFRRIFKKKEKPEE